MEHVLSVNSLSKEYVVKNKSVKAVDDISFHIEKGEIVGLLGPNGAGKTSVVKMICGLVYPDQGEINILGESPWLQRKKALKNVSAVLEGNRNIYWPLTVRENMEYFTALHGISSKHIKGKIDGIIERLGLKEKKDTTARNLSRGMQQKLALGVSLLKDVPVIILDEPTLGLDVEATLDIRNLLKSLAEDEQKTILITTHDMHLVEAVCERAIIINRGKVISDQRVEDILQLLNIKAYQINIKGALSKQQKNDLLNLGIVRIEEAENKGTTIHVNLEDSELLYIVMEILHREKNVIESIYREEIDFENVFLEIVKGGLKV